MYNIFSKIYKATTLVDTISGKCNCKLFIMIKNRVILEDRRVRMNAWVAKILDIPIEKIKTNKHVNPGARKSEVKDPSNLNFTLDRKLPLTMTTKKEDITFVIFCSYKKNRHPLNTLYPYRTKTNTTELKKDLSLINCSIVG